MAPVVVVSSVHVPSVLAVHVPLTEGNRQDEGLGFEACTLARLRTHGESRICRSAPQDSEGAACRWPGKSRRSSKPTCLAAVARTLLRFWAERFGEQHE